MLAWGYETDMRRWLVPLLDFTRKNLECHQAGFKAGGSLPLLLADSRRGYRA